MIKENDKEKKKIIFEHEIKAFLKCCKEYKT